MFNSSLPLIFVRIGTRFLVFELAIILEWTVPSELGCACGADEETVRARAEAGAERHAGQVDGAL